MNKLQKRRYIVLVINFLIFVMTMRVFDLTTLNINFTRSNEQRKYVLYECSRQGLCGGLVDRFKGIINAYAWALFTNRQLIIKMTKPCDFVNLMVPNQINWDIDLDQIVKYGDLKANYTIHKINQLDSFSYKSDLTNMDIINYQNESDVISVFTNLEWISAYARNKYAKVIINEIQTI
jgi:hypothetical protein